MSDFFLTNALAAVLWQLPWLIAGVAIIAIAIAKRDGGLWWRLLAGGGVLILLEHGWTLLLPTLVSTSQNHYTYWVLTLPNLVLPLLAVGLLAGAAVTNRRPVHPSSRAVPARYDRA